MGNGAAGEENLPWLESVEDDYREAPSYGRLILLGIALAAVVAAAIGAYFWYANQKGLTGTGELIAAPEGDYKVKPDEPGGRVVSGEGDTVFATSQGAATNASINAMALPEAPIEGAVVAAKSTEAGSAVAKVAVPAPQTAPVPKPVPVAVSAPAQQGGGSLVQLGAFPSEAGANAAWTRMSKRFGYLAPLGKSVEKGEADTKLVWRLRVNAGSNAQAREVCGKLQIAGEKCFVTN